MNKLVKTKNRTLFGVCGGVAKFLGVDVSIIRILFVLGAIATGSILLWIYILLALILPNEE
jgi:phage shock protein PspC (stress-responsive transcriptional regulator)